MDEKTNATETTMESLLNTLEAMVEKSYHHAGSYRDLLRNLENVTLSWEEPQPESKDIPVQDTTHVNRLSRALDELRISINKNSEILEHLHRLI